MAADLQKHHFEFSNIVSCDDGVLFEIFVRLPDQRSAVRCRSVCKRWRSLISNPNFASAFVKHHTNRLTDAPIPYTLLTDIRAFDYKFFSKLEFYTDNGDGGDGGDSYISFLPWSRRAVVKASWGDLLLVSEIESRNEFIVCNPVTKQWVALPPSPSTFLMTNRDTCGLFCDPARTNNNNNSIRFVVCFVNLSNSLRSFEVLTFCSEIGQWTQSSLTAPFEGRRAFLGKAVVLDGALHFIHVGEPSLVKGMSVYRPLQDPNSVVSFALPREFRGQWQYFSRNTHLGVVRGRLRLSQMFPCDNGFSLKVWEFVEEFCASSLTWVLIHNVVVKRPNKNNKVKNHHAFVVAFDPNDCNVVFLVDGPAIFRYEIDSGKCIKVDDVRPEIKTMFRAFADGFIIMQPSWHTNIPSILVSSPI